jgi:predicted DNA-binding transcriptional regulator AlpA
MRTKPEIAPEDRLIGSAEVAARLNCHIITLYRRLKSDPEFPRPIRRVASNRKLAWRESAIRDYVSARERESVAA